MKQFREFITHHRKLALLLPFAVSVLLSTGIARIRIKDDIVEMLPKKLPSMIALKTLEKTFGAADFVTITIGEEHKSVFNYGTLSKIKRITEEIKSLPYVDRVNSITNIERIKGTEYGLDICPVMEFLPSTQAELDRLEESVFAEEDFVGTFVSRDKRFASILTSLTTEPVDAGVAYGDFMKIIDKERGPEEIHLGGVPIIAGIVGESIRLDMKRLIPLVIVILIGILYLSMHSWSGVFLTILLIVLSVAPVIGLMGFLNRPVMVINSAIPIILLALSSAYSVHMIMKYYHAECYKSTKREAVIHTVDELFLPVSMAAFTTILGFLSLVTSTLPVLFEFGLLVALGIFWAWVLAMVMLPALLLLLPPPKVKPTVPKHHTSMFGLMLRLISKIVIRFKKLIIILSACLVMVSFSGIRQLRVESSLDRFFSKKSDLVIGNRISNEHFRGAANLSLLVDGDITDPRLLARMLEFQKYLTALDEVGGTSSIANVLCRINQAMHDDAPAFRKIPATREAVSQALLLYSMAADPADLRMLVNEDYTLAHINVGMRSIYTKDLKEVLRKVNDYCIAHFEKGVNISTTGSSVFIKEISERSVVSSVLSLITSLIAVFVLCAIVYRSVFIGFLNIVPLFISGLSIYAFMGFFGIDFSIEIAIISSIVIGVGIDYAIHYMSRYCLVGNHLTPDQAADAIINTVGFPILSNAVSVAAGFLALSFSRFSPLRSLGFLVAVSMFLTSMGALTILASLINIAKPRIRHRILIFEE